MAESGRALAARSRVSGPGTGPSCSHATARHKKKGQLTGSGSLTNWHSRSCASIQSFDVVLRFVAFAFFAMAILSIKFG